MTEWLTTSQAAWLWELNPSTIRRAILEKRITPTECKKLGRDWFVKESALERLYGRRRRKFLPADIEKIEQILDIRNLGIDFDAFESGDELADWLDGRQFPGFDEPFRVSQEQREALREIYNKQ